KIPRGHAYNRRRTAVDTDLFADHSGIAGEALLPERVAQNDGGGLARMLGFSRKHEPAKAWLKPEGRKIVVAYRADGDQVGVRVCGEVDAAESLAEDFAERLGLFAEFDELRVREAEGAQRGAVGLNH